MEQAAYLATIRGESERFLQVLADVPLDAPVPSCDGWTAADLLWHLGEVQHTWARVAAGEAGEAVPPPERPQPDDAAGLRALVARSGTELLAALADLPADAPVWSWHPDGGTGAWVVRRMAHEALVHRVDAELTAGLDVRPPSVELAADGVDEVLSVFVDGAPAWGTFAPGGVVVDVRCTNADAAWRLELGRFRGTSPTSGTDHDLDAAAVRQVAGEGAPSGEEGAPSGADLTVAGHAWDLDRWLWGRGDAAALEVAGDAAVLERLRALLRDATQ